MNITTIYEAFLSCDSVSTDTRNIGKNSLFVALKGERFDANTFAEEALNKGASFVIIDNPEYFLDARTIVVNDRMVKQQLKNLLRLC